MSTTQPKDLMALEDAMPWLLKLREHFAERVRNQNARALGSEEKEWWEEQARLEKVNILDPLDAALHHLEAGKDKRYTPQDMIFAAAFGINKLGENFPELKSTAPTAHEAKENICPGCGKPSNHMEAGTTSDHWGVWHSECEKEFWMAGTGLDDRVPPFSRRNVAVKEEPC